MPYAAVAQLGFRCPSKRMRGVVGGHAVESCASARPSVRSVTATSGRGPQRRVDLEHRVVAGARSSVSSQVMRGDLGGDRPALGPWPSG